MSRPLLLVAAVLTLLFLPFAFEYAFEFPASDTESRDIQAAKLEPGSGAAGGRKIKALAAAYPERIEEVSFRDGDWSLHIDGSWFSWASGRLLPEEAGRDGTEEGMYIYVRPPC